MCITACGPITFVPICRLPDDDDDGVAMRSVRLFDFIEYNACSSQVVAQDGPLLALKNLSTMNTFQHTRCGPA